MRNRRNFHLFRDAQMNQVPPDLLRFRVTPRAILIRLQKRKVISSFPQSAILL